MSVRQDIINLVVNINGDKAKSELNELRKTAAEAGNSVHLLEKQEARLSRELKIAERAYKDVVKAFGHGTPQAFAAGKSVGDLAVKLGHVRTELIPLKAAAETADNAFTKARKAIGLTAFTVKELGAEINRLTKIRNLQIPGSKEFKQYDADLKKVIIRQQQVQGGMAGFQKATAGFKQVGANINNLLLGFFGFQAAVGAIGKVINGAIKLSDQLASLRRVAGFTKEEASNLNTELLKLNTRTSGEGLLSIAITAGKLGVAKKDILGFTESVDKLVVTLGDELGDADQITTQLGKILNVFDGEVNGDNISKLGNAFIELANAGVASGGFIADFTQRVSGLAKSAGITLGSTVGLAAGFEELGLRVESSSTALQKIITTIANDIPKAAKIAGIPFKEFNKLFADQPQEALLKYAEGLVKDKGAFAEVTAGFKLAGEEGQHVQATLQAIGQKSDFLRKKMEFGNATIKEQTALNKGADEMNTTLAGSIEKLGKTFDRLAASTSLNNFLKNATNLADALFTSLERISNDGLANALDRTIRGFAIYMVKGSEALGRYRQDFEDMRNATKEQKQEVFNYEFVPNSKRSATTGFEGTGIGLPVQKNTSATAPTAETGEQKAAREKAASEREASLKRAEDFHKKELDEIRKANRDQAEELKSKYKEIADDQTKSLEERYDALKLYYEVGKTLIEKDKLIAQAQLDDEIATARKAATTKKEMVAIDGFRFAKQNALNRSSALATSKFEQQVSNDYAAVAEQNYKKISEAGRAAYEELKRASNDAYKRQQDDIILDTDNRLLQLDQDFKEGRIKKLEDFETLRTKIIGKGKKKELEYELTTLQTFNRILNAQGIVSKDLEKKIADAQLGINAGDRDQDEADEKIRIAKRLKKIDEIKEDADLAIEIAGDISTALAAGEEKKLNKERRETEAKNAGFKKLLDRKLISERRYNKMVEQENEKYDKRKAAIELKAFKRQQALSLAGAIINGATAITKIWAEVPKADFGISTIILTALSAATTLAQIVAIKSQAPPEAAKGGVFKGASHSEGGMTVYDNKTGKPTVEVEGDEPWMVLSKNTMRNNGPVINALLDSSMKKNGAPINIVPPWKMQRLPQINTAKVVPLLANGGIVQTKPTSLGLAISENNNYNIEILANRMEKALERFNGRITAEVVYSDFKKKEDLLNKAKRASGIN